LGGEGAEAEAEAEEGEEEDSWIGKGGKEEDR
jgi:hypothetical protein